MGFPLSVSGTVRLSLDPRLTVDEVACALEQALRAHDVEHVVRTGARISFEVPGVMGSGRAFADRRLRLVRSGRRSPLTAITSGELELVWRDGGHSVRYEIGFLGLLLLVSFVVVFVAAIVCTSPGGGGAALVVAPIAWLWLFGGNCLLARGAFSRFLRRVQVHEAA